MTLPPITIAITAVGCPGAAALLRALRENGERDVKLVGTDMAETVYGRFICDSFHRVPAGDDPGFAGAMLEICQAERVDVLLPQSSNDLEALAEAKDGFGETRVLVSPLEAIQQTNDKAASYALLARIGVHGPAWRRVRGGDELAQAARELGYPERDVCIKPVVSSGTRGFRPLSASADRREQLLTNRPGVPEALRLEEATELVADSQVELLVMELATGKERTIDGYAEGGEILLGHAKTREKMRAGLAMYFETLDAPELMETAATIVRELELEAFFNIQLVGECVIEVNARISTVVYQEDLNLPYLGIKRALGELSADELRAFAARIRPSRRALRYFDQLEWDV